MSQGSGLPHRLRFDALKLAAEDDALSGLFDARDFGRVADRLAPGRGAVGIDWRIDGGQDALRRPQLVVAIAGKLPLICQRCLQPFDAPVSQQTHLLLARNDEELKLLDAEEAEVLLASGLIDARTLVEDEVLLSLPFAPHHAEGKCAPGTGWTSGARHETQARKRSPFASLAELKKKR